MWNSQKESTDPGWTYKNENSELKRIWAKSFIGSSRKGTGPTHQQIIDINNYKLPQSKIDTSSAIFLLSS